MVSGLLGHLSALHTDDRGIYHTLSAIGFLVAIVAGIVVSIQAVPLDEKRATAADFEEAQVSEKARDVFAVANATGDLQQSVVYWNDSAGQWIESGSSGYYTHPPSGNPLETPLQRLLRNDGIGYIIDVRYQAGNGTTSRERMVYQGTPGTHAVTATHSVLLYDDTELASDDTTLSEAESFYAPDVFPDSPKYNVVQVRIIAWKS